MAGLRTFLGPAVACALLVLAFEVVTVEAEGPTRRLERGSDADAVAAGADSASGEARRGEARRGEDDARPAAQRTSERVAVAVRSHPGEDELTMRWSELSAEARVRELRQQYRAALAAMERGSDFEVHRARADAAVSALRAELYATPSGRKEHERLEQRLQALVDRERAQSAPEGGTQ